MLNEAVEMIYSCRSIEELRRLWAVNCGKWSQLPHDAGLGLIDFKNWKKGQLEEVMTRWTIDSKIIGQVELVYDENEPDWAVVDGVVYRADELERLLGRGMRREDILAVHEIKRVFDGWVCGVGENEGCR